MDLLYATGISAAVAALLAREQRSPNKSFSDADSAAYDFSGPSWDSPKPFGQNPYDAWWKYHFETAEWEARDKGINPSTWTNPYERRLNNWHNRASTSRQYDL